MKLNSAQVEQTLSQFEAQALSHAVYDALGLKLRFRCAQTRHAPPGF
jgi:hypothetical protein